jgi:hypothetical protein
MSEEALIDLEYDGYAKSMVAAGAVVHKKAEFGSYQGDWWALVTFSGKTGWVNGSYGSCSGCDAFESEFGYGDEDQPDYHDRLKAFGLGYLDNILDQETAEKEAARNIEWDFDAEEMLQYLKANAITRPTESESAALPAASTG